MNGTVFVGGGRTTVAEARLYSFRPGWDSAWTVINTPTSRYALTEYDSQLLLVGGIEYFSEQFSNKVFTLRNGEFVETLPPMREKRYRPSVVSSDSILVVAGGFGNSAVYLSSVEVFKDGQWITAPSVPTVDYTVSAHHGDMWYLMNTSVMYSVLLYILFCPKNTSHHGRHYQALHMIVLLLLFLVADSCLSVEDAPVHQPSMHFPSVPSPGNMRLTCLFL